ncbi:MAG: ABC transporter ATP-binding protein [Myxococcales bacterium]|nr:ABC transporter ATP-binding protein [Myxococcales bacterium]USN51172.1 MAG: ABC transporter ATP-binding protein [Myxococcales bacterium]
MSKKNFSKEIFAYGIPMEHQPISFLKLLGPHKLKMFFGLLALVITNLLAVSLPSLINSGIELLKNSGERRVTILFSKWIFHDVLSVIACIIILALFGAVVRTLSRILIFDVGRMVERDLREEIIKHVSGLDDNFFSHFLVGDILNHLTSDVNNIRMMAGFVLLSIFNMLIVFIFSVPLLFKIDMILALCALLPFPLVMFATRRLTRRVFEATKNYQACLGAVVNRVQENLSGAHLIRLFHQQDAEAQRFYTTNNDAYEAGVRLAKLRNLMLPTMRLMIGFAIALVLFVGGNMIFMGHLGVGDLVEVNARILQLTWPAMSLGFVISIMSRGKASIVRINEILKSRPIIIDGSDEISAIHQIHVSNLKLNKENKIPLNFKLHAGEMLGVVGPSGSYKTSLLKMLYRRVVVDPGKIFYNQHDIINLQLNSISKNICVVAQEPFLFHRSIRDNINFFAPHASEEDLVKVIAQVSLDKDIKNFSQGLDTVIGERGVTLSGGQRQRVALARALLANKSLLILDDALSAVDAQTEEHILSSIKETLKDRVVIVATHRLSAIKDAQQILVLDAGDVVARGNHQQLLESNILYQELWGERYA